MNFGELDAGLNALDVVRLQRASDGTPTALIVDGAPLDLGAGPAGPAGPAGSGGTARGFFQANKLVDQNLSTSSTVTRVDCDEVVDQEGWFASSRYTPQIAGWYRFDTNVYIDAPAQLLCQFTIALNGAGTGGVNLYLGPLSGTGRIVPISGVIYMNGTTDYAEVIIVTDVNAPSGSVKSALFSFSGSLLYQETAPEI